MDEDEGDMPVIRDPSAILSNGSATVFAFSIRAGSAGSGYSLWSVVFGVKYGETWLEELIQDIGLEDSPVTSHTFAVPPGMELSAWRILVENDAGNQTEATGEFNSAPLSKADSAVCVGRPKGGLGTVSLDPLLVNEPYTLGVTTADEIGETDIPIKMTDEL